MEPSTFSEPVIARLCTMLPDDALLAKGRETGFAARAPRKITPAAFVRASCMVAQTACRSLEAMALAIGVMTGRSVSKQAVSERITKRAVALLHEAVSMVLSTSLGWQQSLGRGVFAQFGRVLLQDSTCVSLPDCLARVFPGSRNHLRAYAVLKIQTVYDLLAERFVKFKLTPFSCNDQAAAPDILDLLREHDLVIRDLGYFTLVTFAAIHDRNAFFLSRLRYGTSIFDEAGATRLDLLALLRRDGSLDRVVRLGVGEKLPVRIVAIPIPQSEADARRRALRTNRDRRCQPSKEHLALCGWEIFITNVHADVWPMEVVCHIYNLRWRIEIVFKSWKSHFRMRDVAGSSAAGVQIAICARLIWAMLFQAFFAAVRADACGDAHTVSLLKCAKLFEVCCLVALGSGLTTSVTNLGLLVLRNVRYDKRRRRSYGRKRIALLRLNALTPSALKALT